jgi:hypothetical protein
VLACTLKQDRRVNVSNKKNAKHPAVKYRTFVKDSKSRDPREASQPLIDSSTSDTATWLARKRFRMAIKLGSAA